MKTKIIRKSDAKTIADSLTLRARKCFMAAFSKSANNSSQRRFSLKSKKEFGRIITELVVYKLIRCDWNIFTDEQIFVLQPGARFVLDYLEQNSKGDQ